MVWDQVDPRKDSVHELEVSDDRADVLFFFFFFKQDCSDSCVENTRRGGSHGIEKNSK